jgi:hypothetical protein
LLPLAPAVVCAIMPFANGHLDSVDINFSYLGTQ